MTAGVSVAKAQIRTLHDEDALARPLDVWDDERCTLQAGKVDLTAARVSSLVLKVHLERQVGLHLVGELHVNARRDHRRTQVNSKFGKMRLTKLTM